MNWLEDYFAKNLSKGKNDVTFTPVEPEPQTPFKGEALAVPGKIEVEDFDIPGKGKNEDGTSNASYADDGENHGDSDYRKDTGADLYKKATGIALGYNNTGDWYEYTINVAEAGEYTAVASVATEGTGAFTLSLDGKALADFEVTGTSYDEFSNVSKKVTLPAGKHILRMEVTQEYFDIDYINFVKGDAGEPQFVQQNVKFDNNSRQDYHVFDQNGVHMGVLTAYGFDAAKEILQHSSAVKSSGIYYLRSRTTGQMQSVRVTR
jgi:hypothetical protein